MNVRYFSLAFVAFFALNTPSRAATLVTNGGFETGDFTGWTGGFPDNFVASGDASLVHTGTKGVAFGSVESLSDLSQSLATVSGTIYDVSFWLNSNGFAANEVKVTWGGLTISPTLVPPAGPGTRSCKLQRRALRYLISGCVKTSAIRASTTSASRPYRKPRPGPCC